MSEDYTAPVFDLVSECNGLNPISRPVEERSVDSEVDCKQSDGNEAAEDEIPIWICGEPRYISGISPTTTCREIIQALIDDELRNDNDDDDNGNNDGDDGVSTTTSLWTNEKGRQPPPMETRSNVKDFASASRDLADYVITERWRDVEQALDAQTHILPIWLAWGSARNEIRFKLKINKSKANGGGGHRHRHGQQRSRDNNAAGDLFTAGNAYKKPQDPATKKKHKFHALAKTLKRLVLQSETIQERLCQLKQHEHKIPSPNNITATKLSLPTTPSEAANMPAGKALLLDNFLDDSVQQQHQTHQAHSKIEPRNVEHIYAHHVHMSVDPATLQPINIQSTDDELFLLIDDKAPRRHAAFSASPSKRRCTDYGSDDLDSGVHVEYRQYVLNRKLQSNMAQQQNQQRMSSKLLRLAEEGATPKQQHSRQCRSSRCDGNALLRSHNINRSAALASVDVASAPLATSSSSPRAASAAPQPLGAKKQQSHGETMNCIAQIRQEVATRLLDVDQLLQYEHQLQAALEQNGGQFRAQNELYTRASGVLAEDVERVQARLDAYAKRIVDGEFELFKVQLEISQKCGVLHNLQRMLAIAEDIESDSSCSTLSHQRRGHHGNEHVMQRIESEHRKQWAEMRSIEMDEEREKQFVDETFVDNVNEFCDRNKTIIV